MSLKKCITALFFITGCTLSHASQNMDVKVLINGAKNWATQDGDGFAQEMFRRVSRLADMPNELLMYPAGRLPTLFIHQDNDCIFAGNEDFLENSLFSGQVDVISSIPFTEDTINAFTLKGESVISSPADLIGKRVLLGFSSADILLNDKPHETNLNALDIDIFVLEANKQEQQALFMLSHDRADVYIRYRGSMAKSDLAKLNYDPHFKLYSIVDSLNCHNNPRLRRYVDKMSEAIEYGIRNGTFDDLYEKFGRVKPVLD
jgi:hypothetical protein